jgi:uncharacterized protein YkwD
MRALIRAVVLAALLLILPGLAATQAVAAPSAAQQVLALVNTARSEAGCGPVRLDPRLNAAASKHSTDMATNDYFSHTGRNGSTFVTRIAAEGYPTARSENIAAGNATARATVTQWMNSAGHRRNILDCSAKDMGVGVASNPRSTYRTYWTQDFGRG